MSYAKPTAARLIDQRARRRATQALLRAHHDEFRMLFMAERAKAEEEAGRLASARRTQSVQAHSGEPPRLMSGRYKPGQESTDRIDVARCPHCVSHHDRGHVCTRCGAVPNVAVVVPDDGEIDEIAVERAVAGDPVGLTESELHEAFRRQADKGHSDESIAARLGVTSRTILRWRQDAGIVSRWSA